MGPRWARTICGSRNRHGLAPSPGKADVMVKHASLVGSRSFMVSSRNRFVVCVLRPKGTAFTAGSLEALGDTSREWIGVC